LFSVSSRRPRGFWRAAMRYFLGVLQVSLKQSVCTHYFSEATTLVLPLKCRPHANPIPSNPLANATLTLRPKFPFLHQLHTRVPLRNTKPRRFLASSSVTLLAPTEAEPSGGIPVKKFSHPDRSSGAICRFAAEGSRQPNQPRCNSIRRAALAIYSPTPPIRFSYPSHSFFLLWKFLFPFDAAFPLALPLPCQ